MRIATKTYITANTGGVNRPPMIGMGRPLATTPRRGDRSPGAGASAAPPACGGGTPLHLASRRGDCALVELLLEHGADAAAKHDGGVTPLHLCASSDPACAALLLSNMVAYLLVLPRAIDLVSSPAHSLRAARAAMRAEAKAKARSEETASRLARRVADAAQRQRKRFEFRCRADFN